jgi:hypothetical protein
VASTLAVGLLVAGCVFAAMAGPALSLHARSEALHQTTAKLAPTVKAVQISANWTNFVDSLLIFAPGGSQNVPEANQNLTTSQLARATHEIKGSLAGLPLPLGPGDWYGLGSIPTEVTSRVPPSAVISGNQPKLEVLYRDPLSSNATLVAGSYSAGREPPGTVAGASTPVLFQADVTAFGVPAAAVVTLALAALTTETRTLRRRRIVGILRAT